MKQANFTAGCDPEYFLRMGRRYLSAIPFVKGTKEEPEPLPSGAFVMRDNVAIEFGIPPASTEQEFSDSILTALLELKEYLPKGIELACVPSAHFPLDQLNHPEAVEFGCSPDFNAWSGEQNCAPDGAVVDTFRSCGGHFHTGFWYAKTHPKLFIKWQDMFQGMISTSLDNSLEAIARRKLYGKAGCYRETDYGVEYRTLSNFWLKDEAHIRLQYSLVNDICNGIDDGKMVMPDLEPDVVQQIINEGDDNFAKAIIKDYFFDEYFSNHTKLLLEEVGYEN